MIFTVLTKSAKKMNDHVTYGNCVAGFNEQGDWLRLVSDVDGDSLPDSTCRAFSCLDVIDVDVTPCPITNHPENVKLERFNKKVGRCSIDNVIEDYGLDNEQFCFINNHYILNEQERRRVDSSLMIIKVKDLRVYKNNQNSSKAQFIYNDIQYDNISVTDNRNKKPMELGEAYLVVSLPAETDGFSGYYKFIAAIYPV